MKRLQSLLIYCMLAFFCMGVFTSCGKGKREFNKIPATTFIKHYQFNEEKLKPFDSYWLDEKKQQQLSKQKPKKNSKLQVYIEPVTLAYLTKTPATKKYASHIEELREHFDTSLSQSFTRKSQSVQNMELVKKKTRNAYKLEVAILAVNPTPLEGNILKQAAGIYHAVAGVFVSQVERKGYTIMAARFITPDGDTLVELADFEPDNSAIIGIDFKDFSHFAHHKRRISQWADELAETFSTLEINKVRRPPVVSLNPF